MGKKKTLSGNQEKIDANKDGQITKQTLKCFDQRDLTCRVHGSVSTPSNINEKTEVKR